MMVYLLPVATFTCKLCGRSYEGVREPAPEIAPEEVEKLRQAWLTADEKLTKSPDNEHLERAHQKAWFAYMATKSSGVERIPEALTTKKGPDGFFLLCSTPCAPDGVR